MSKSNATETDLLAKVFTNTALPWDGVTNLYLSLHTADPGEAGDQTTSECAYTSYARVAVARSGVGWTVAGSSSVNAAQIQFPICTGGSETATHVGIGTTSSGAGQLLYKGALTSSLAISNNVRPQFAASALQVQED